MLRAHSDPSVARAPSLSQSSPMWHEQFWALKLALSQDRRNTKTCRPHPFKYAHTLMTETHPCKTVVVIIPRQHWNNCKSPRIATFLKSAFCTLRVHSNCLNKTCQETFLKCKMPLCPDLLAIMSTYPAPYFPTISLSSSPALPFIVAPVQSKGATTGSKFLSFIHL